MEKNLFLFGILILAIALIFGCTGTKTTETTPTHTLVEYLGMSNTENNIYTLSIDVSVNDELLLEEDVRNIRYNDVFKQSGSVNMSSFVAIYKQKIGVMCVEDAYFNIICFKLMDEATDFLKNGIGFDRELPDNAVVTYVGTETSDSVTVDCFDVILNDDYMGDRFKDLGFAYGILNDGNFKLCYGKEDGLLRKLDGVLTLTSRLSGESIKLRMVGNVELIGPSQKSDVESVVPFAIGNVDCMAEDSVDIELISLVDGGTEVVIESIVVPNQTVTLTNYLEIEEGTYNVVDTDLFDFAYFEGYSLGTICDLTKDYCLPIFCD